MLYLASTFNPRTRDAMRAGMLGQLTTPNIGNVLEPDVPWALDNGCFGEKWSEDKWVTTLEKHAGRPRCLFAVVPDVVGDSDGTDARWDRYADTVKSYGYPAAYATQNGCREIPDDADVVFTGGNDEWKLGAPAQRLAAEAKARGLWTHMGRVNTLERIRFAHWHGYDSVDGTFLAFGPDVNLPRLLRYMRATLTQAPLFSPDLAG